MYLKWLLTSLSASCANDRADKITPIIVILFKTLSTAKFKGRRKREERNWILSYPWKTLYHKTP